jgi:hypothetical protein
MRGVATAAAIGAAISALLFVGFTFGVDMYFRVAQRLEQKREKAT